MLALLENEGGGAGRRAAFSAPRGVEEAVMPAVVAEVDMERDERRGGSRDRFRGAAEDLLADSGDSDCGGEFGASSCGGDAEASSPESAGEVESVIVRVWKVVRERWVLCMVLLCTRAKGWDRQRPYSW